MSKPASSAPPDGLSPVVLWFYALILIVVWGMAFTILSIGVQHIPPIWLVVYRSVLATALVSAYICLCGHRFPPLTDVRWLWYTALGVTGMVLPFFLTGLAQTRIDSGLSAILTGTMPLMTIILAHFFAAERLSWRKGFGFILGLVGTVVLFLPGDIGPGIMRQWEFQMMSVLAAFFYAVTTVAARRAPPTPSSVGTAMMLAGASVASLIWALFTGPPGGFPPLEGILAVIGLAAGSSAIGTILYLLIIDRAGPTTMARINYFPPCVSVAAGILFLNEEFTLRIAVAFALIMLGVWVARERQAKFSTPSTDSSHRRNNPANRPV